MYLPRAGMKSWPPMRLGRLRTQESDPHQPDEQCAYRPEVRPLFCPGRRVTLTGGIQRRERSITATVQKQVHSSGDQILIHVMFTRGASALSLITST